MKGANLLLDDSNLLLLKLLFLVNQILLVGFLRNVTFFSIDRIETDILILVILCYNVNCVKRFLYFENYRAMLKSNIRIIDFVLFLYIYIYTIVCCKKS